MPSYVYVASQDDNQIVVFTINGETGGLTRQAEVPYIGRAVPAGDKPQPALCIRWAPRGPGDIKSSHRPRHRRAHAPWQCLASRLPCLFGHRPPR